MSAPSLVGGAEPRPPLLDVEIKHEVLHLAVERLGQTRPGKLAICRQRDQRTPTAKRAARLVYQRSLQRIVEQRFPTGRVPALRIFSRPRIVIGTPLLFLVAPALHVHPATDTLLHYISPEIEWVVVGIDERRRDGMRAVFRKRPRGMELKIDPGSRDCA